MDRDEIARLTQEYGGDWGMTHTRRLLRLIETILLSDADALDPSCPRTHLTSRMLVQPLSKYPRQSLIPLLLRERDAERDLYSRCAAHSTTTIEIGGAPAGALPLTVRWPRASPQARPLSDSIRG